jgi:hypothetical protein
VVQRFEVGLGQRRGDLYTLTVERRVEEPVAPSATLPPELLAPVVLEGSVSGVRPPFGSAVPELVPPVVPADGGVVGLVGTVPVLGEVTVPPGAGVVRVGVVGVVVVVGTVVVVVPGVVGVPMGVVVVEVGVDVVGVLSEGALSGSMTSEMGSARGGASPVRGAAGGAAGRLLTASAVSRGCLPAGVAAPTGATGVDGAVCVWTLADTVVAAGEDRDRERGCAAAVLTMRW